LEQCLQIELHFHLGFGHQHVLQVETVASLSQVLRSFIGLSTNNVINQVDIGKPSLIAVAVEIEHILMFMATGSFIIVGHLHIAIVNFAASAIIGCSLAVAVQVFVVDLDNFIAIAYTAVIVTFASGSFGIVGRFVPSISSTAIAITSTRVPSCFCFL